MAVETLGVWGGGAEELLAGLGKRLGEATGDARAGFFLRQRVDIAIQRANALSVLGTFPQTEDRLLGLPPCPDSFSFT